MTVRVIGLDVSVRSTGLAMPDGRLHTIKPQAGADDPARRLNQIVAQLDPYLVLAKADVAVIEGYSGAFGKGGAHTMLRLAEVGGAVRMRLFEHGVRYVEVAPSTLKKYAVGFGGSSKRPVSKDEMVAAAVASGAEPRNPDEADAFWCWAIGRAQFSETWEPAFRSAELLDVRREVREGLRWPALEGVA